MLVALPAGAQLDGGGTFVWTPGLAFGGMHEVVFIDTSDVPSIVHVRLTVPIALISGNSPLTGSGGRARIPAPISHGPSGA